MRNEPISTLTVASSGRRRRGAILPMVLIFGFLLVTMAGGMVAISTHQTRTRARYEVYKDEFAAAETALNKAYAQAKFLRDYRTPTLLDEMENITPPIVADYTFPTFEVTKLSDATETPDSGQWAGFPHRIIRYRIEVTALKHSPTADRYKHSGVSLSENLEIEYVPLFIFAIFYDPTMEIAPGPFMQVNGRVHANGDAYFQSQSGLNFTKNVSIAGEIHHGRHPASGKTNDNGDVSFSNDTSLKSMARNDADGWLTSSDADWSSAAANTWQGGLANKAHGVRPLSLPIPADLSPHSIIERADASTDGPSLQAEKFENKASLKIMTASNGTVKGYDQDGNQVALTYKDPNNKKKTKSIVKTTSFYDAREGKTVTSTDIDMANMIESGIMPDNGILYVSNADTSGKVVRLTNGAELPVAPGTTGLTVATDLPLYIEGDYNTIDKGMAMVVADALYILSNNWNDSNSTDYSKRMASNTTVNAVCMQGIVPTANNNYSGGVENYFRFLEQWDGKSFTFSGSIINLWQSQTAMGKWFYGSPVYTAPQRNWSWDTALGGMSGPPGAPQVIFITKKSWELVSSD